MAAVLIQNTLIQNTLINIENPVAFSRWMLSDPEPVRLQQHFEDEYLFDNDPENPRNFLNHEQGFATKKTFQHQVQSHYKTFKKMGNPFLVNFPELVNLIVVPAGMIQW